MVYHLHFHKIVRHPNYIPWKHYDGNGHRFVPVVGETNFKFVVKSVQKKWAFRNAKSIWNWARKMGFNKIPWKELLNILNQHWQRHMVISLQFDVATLLNNSLNQIYYICSRDVSIQILVQACHQIKIFQVLLRGLHRNSLTNCLHRTWQPTCSNSRENNRSLVKAWVETSIPRTFTSKSSWGKWQM